MIPGLYEFFDSVAWDCKQPVTQSLQGFASAGMFFFDCLLLYSARSAALSKSSVRSPGSNSFHPTENSIGMVRSSASTSRDSRRFRTVGNPDDLNSVRSEERRVGKECRAR